MESTTPRSRSEILAELYLSVEVMNHAYVVEDYEWAAAEKYEQHRLRQEFERS